MSVLCNNKEHVAKISSISRLENGLQASINDNIPFGGWIIPDVYPRVFEESVLKIVISPCHLQSVNSQVGQIGLEN